mmetsp:Transcript_31668/g.63255  ORF Transcript_31668/g.63255 Transcript_31668/m.63255 type:complete len:235 (+) Transcript_31668:542-1246(+)
MLRSPAASCRRSARHSPSARCSVPPTRPSWLACTLEAILDSTTATRLSRGSGKQRSQTCHIAGSAVSSAVVHVQPLARGSMSVSPSGRTDELPPATRALKLVPTGAKETMSPFLSSVCRAVGVPETRGTTVVVERLSRGTTSPTVAPRAKLRMRVVRPFSVKTKTRVPSSSWRTSFMNSCAHSCSSSHLMIEREKIEPEIWSHAPPGWESFCSVYAQCAAAPYSATMCMACVRI